MRRIFVSAILAAAVAGISFGPIASVYAQPKPDAQAQPAEKGTQVPVKAVVLFSSGVGYFEHFGTVKGSGSTELRFKTQQINDILKSLVLQDLDGGKVTTISYPSQDPIAKTLRSFQIDITSNPSLGELLNQLRGAKVKVTLGPESTEGIILGLEKKQKSAGDKDKGIIEVWMLNLISNGGTIRSVELDMVTKIELEDKQLQEELTKALTALSQARDQDKKPVTVNFTGEGERHVKIGYIVETPVWKTSYRLILGDKQAQLQGWAIVENQTDNDWNEVELSLVSGRPISFIQDLYQPLYVPRPVVRPQLYASLRPQTYEGGLQSDRQVEKFREEQLADADMPAMPSGPARASGGRGGAGGGGGVGGAAGAGNRPASLRPDNGLSSDAGKDLSKAAFDPTASISSVASAAKIGELFQYTVGSVSLPRQRSAMIPIITDPVEVERLSIYNPTVLPKNPLNGARLKNTTDKHLLAGPITVIDASSYAGDASVDNLPPGQERLISYGVDLQVLVDATKNKQDSVIQSGSIIKGVLHLTRRHQFTQDYLADNKSDKEKTLVIEHPLRRGWKLVDTIKPIETTETLYRFKGKIAPGKITSFSIKEEIVQGETFAILPADVGALDFYSKQGEIPKPVREALLKAMGFKAAMVTTQRLINEKQQQVQQITVEQQRIRDNMRTVQQNTEYYNRLLSKLNDQESQLEKLQTEIDGLRQTLDKQRKDLETYLEGLDVK